MNLQYLTGLVKSGALLNSPSQLGTLLGDSGGPGTLPRAVQVWTDEGGFADGPVASPSEKLQLDFKTLSTCAFLYWRRIFSGLLL